MFCVQLYSRGCSHPPEEAKRTEAAAFHYSWDQHFPDSTKMTKGFGCISKMYTSSCAIAIRRKTKLNSRYYDFHRYTFYILVVQWNDFFDNNYLLYRFYRIVNCKTGAVIILSSTIRWYILCCYSADRANSDYRFGFLRLFFVANSKFSN